MKLYLQEIVIRGKQLQIPIYGGGWIDVNICTPNQAKLGHAIAEAIVQVLRDHGSEIEILSRGKRRRSNATM